MNHSIWYTTQSSVRLSWTGWTLDDHGDLDFRRIKSHIRIVCVLKFYIRVKILFRIGQTMFFDSRWTVLFFKAFFSAARVGLKVDGPKGCDKTRRSWVKQTNHSKKKRVDDNHKMLVTVLAIFVTNIHYLITLASLHSKDVTEHLNSVSIIHKSSPTLSHQHHDVTNMLQYTLLANFWEISETVLLKNSSIKKSWVPFQFFLIRVVS